MELLYSRMPKDMRAHLIQRVAKFILGNTLPSVAGETAIMLSIPSNIAPEDTRKHFAEPLLASIESELPSLKAKSDAKEGLSISKVPHPDIDTCQIPSFSLFSHPDNLTSLCPWLFQPENLSPQ